MKALRCLQICLAYPPNYNGGGAAITAAALSSALVAQGWDVLVIAPKLSGGVFAKSRLITEALVVKNVSAFFIGSWIQVGFKSINPAAMFIVPREVERSGVVVIHGLRTFCGTIAGIYCLLLGRRYVVFPHGMAVPRWRSLFKKYVYDTLVGTKILRRAERIICLSKTECEEVIRVTGRDARDVVMIDAAQLGTRPAVLLEPRSWDVARILMLGRLVPEKSIEMVIEAIAEQRLRSKYEIWVAGPEEDKSYASSLRARANHLDVAVHFIGEIYEADKDDLMMESHLLALVSDYESYGRTAMEALQLGTPVLVTNTCGIANELDLRCGVVVNRSVREIGEALLSLCVQDFRQLRELRESCRHYLHEDKPVAPQVIDTILGDPHKEIEVRGGAEPLI